MPKKLTAAADARHDGANRATDGIGDLFVAEFLHVGEDNCFGIGLGQLTEGGQDFGIGEFVVAYGCRWNSFLKDIRFIRQAEAEDPFAALVTNHIKEDGKHPGAAVGAELEGMERFPRL